LALFNERGPASDAVAFEYSVRVSTRARQVRLVMKLNGLEVVVPRGFSQPRIPELLEARREWIAKAASRVEARRLLMESDPPRLPERIVLPAVGEEWVVEYRSPGPAGAGSAVRVRRTADFRLVLTGDRGDFEGCKRALCRMLSRRAREALVPRLAELAGIHGFRYERVSIRQQRTRWGSCSRKGTISLNAKLLLMPGAAADYVLLHELCHTVQMNHSARFWALVEKHDPEYKKHKRLVRTSAKAMPTWLDHEPGEEAM
jgi:predicted metal-dependent hydrolase